MLEVEGLTPDGREKFSLQLQRQQPNFFIALKRPVKKRSRRDFRIGNASW